MITCSRSLQRFPVAHVLSLMTLGLMIPPQASGTTLPTAGLVGRYQASSFSGSFNNGDTINTDWTDTGSGGNDATPFGTPTFSTAHGFPTVRFVNADNEGFRANAGPGVSGDFAYWIVVRADLFINNAFIIDRNTNGTPLIDLFMSSTDKYSAFFRASDSTPSTVINSTTAVTPADFRIITLRDTGSLWEFYVDGALEGSTARDNITPDPVLIGNHTAGNNGFTGDITEVLIYDTTQSPSDFADTLAFLQESLQPVPEPSALLLSILGLAALGCIGWRRRRSRR